jgi:hypothetical protein
MSLAHVRALIDIIGLPARVVHALRESGNNHASLADTWLRDRTRGACALPSFDLFWKTQDADTSDLY